jgi:hypothetical protein
VVSPLFYTNPFLARKNLVEQNIASTIEHIQTLTKTVDNQRKIQEVEMQQALQNERFANVENEWLQRKKEMLAARDQIAEREKQRMDRLLASANLLGMKKHELANETKKMNVPDVMDIE